MQLADKVSTPVRQAERYRLLRQIHRRAGSVLPVRLRSPPAASWAGRRPGLVQCTNAWVRFGDQLAKLPVLHLLLMECTDKGLVGNLEFFDLFQVSGMLLFELDDPCAESFLTVRSFSAGANPFVELVLEIKVPLSQSIAGSSGFGRPGCG
ncbi:hypothetical protein GCM10017776_06920 [Streptomyces griseoluteus]|nr:hypothetical protein GCM10017776_06920 [Streptomyces griseoluteus]